MARKSKRMTKAKRMRGYTRAAASVATAIVRVLEAFDNRKDEDED